MPKILAVALCLVTSVAIGAETKSAEQQFKNIQVFKGVPASQIDATMDVMAGALGVGCEFCHVKSEKQGERWPMDKDDKQAKRTARKMVTMMQRINRDFFGGDQVVTCATCHQGHAEPRSIPPLEPAASEEGAGDESAEARKPPSLTAQQLLDKWVQASGGAAAWGKLKTRVTRESVTFAGRGLPKPMPVETVQKAPDRLHVTMTMPNGTFEQGWDGKAGWRKFGGHTMPFEDTADLKREAQFAAPLTLPKLLTGIKALPDATVGKASAHVVDGRQGELRVRLFFDTKSGLLTRMTVRQPTPAGDLAQMIDYADYRTVDGVKLPFRVETNKGGERSTDTVSEIKHNVPVDDAQLAAPAQGK